MFMKCKEGRCLICFPTDAELLLRSAQSNYVSSTSASARVDNPNAGAQIGTRRSIDTYATAPAVIHKENESALPVAPVAVATSVSPSSSIPVTAPPSTFQFDASNFGNNDMASNAVAPSSQFDVSKVSVNTVASKTFDFSNTSPPQPPSSTFKFDASKTTGNFTFGKSSPGDFTTSKSFTFGATKVTTPKLSATIPEELAIEEVESSPPPAPIPNQSQGGTPTPVQNRYNSRIINKLRKNDQSALLPSPSSSSTTRPMASYESNSPTRRRDRFIAKAKDDVSNKGNHDNSTSHANIEHSDNKYHSAIAAKLTGNATYQHSVANTEPGNGSQLAWKPGAYIEMGNGNNAESSDPSKYRRKVNVSNKTDEDHQLKDEPSDRNKYAYKSGDSFASAKSNESDSSSEKYSKKSTGKSHFSEGKESEETAQENDSCLNVKEVGFRAAAVTSSLPMRRRENKYMNKSAENKKDNPIVSRVCANTESFQEDRIASKVRNEGKHAPATLVTDDNRVAAKVHTPAPTATVSRNSFDPVAAKVRNEGIPAPATLISEDNRVAAKVRNEGRPAPATLITEDNRVAAKVRNEGRPVSAGIGSNDDRIASKVRNEEKEASGSTPVVVNNDDDDKVASKERGHTTGVAIRIACDNDHVASKVRNEGIPPLSITVTKDDRLASKVRNVGKTPSSTSTAMIVMNDEKVASKTSAYTKGGGVSHVTTEENKIAAKVRSNGTVTVQRQEHENKVASKVRAFATTNIMTTQTISQNSRVAAKIQGESTNQQAVAAGATVVKENGDNKVAAKVRAASNHSTVTKQGGEDTKFASKVHAASKANFDDRKSAASSTDIQVVKERMQGDTDNDKQRRVAIQAIMNDSSLTTRERQLRVQALMSGRPVPTTVDSSLAKKEDAASAKMNDSIDEGKLGALSSADNEGATDEQKTQPEVITGQRYVRRRNPNRKVALFTSNDNAVSAKVATAASVGAQKSKFCNENVAAAKVSTAKPSALPETCAGDMSAAKVASFGPISPSRESGDITSAAKVAATGPVSLPRASGKKTSTAKMASSDSKMNNNNESTEENMYAAKIPPSANPTETAKISSNQPYLGMKGENFNLDDFNAIEATAVSVPLPAAKAVAVASPIYPQIPPQTPVVTAQPVQKITTKRHPSSNHNINEHSFGSSNVSFNTGNTPTNSSSRPSVDTNALFSNIATPRQFQYSAPSLASLVTPSISMSDSKRLMKTFKQSNNCDYTSLCRIMHQHSKRESLLIKVILLIWEVSENEVNKHVATRDGCVDMVIRTMKLHPLNESIQSYGCGMLLSFTNVTHISSHVFHSSGGDIVIQAMRLHPKNSDVQSRGCGAIMNLAANSMLVSVLGSSGAVDVVIHSLRMFYKKEQVANRACGALQNLASIAANRKLILENRGCEEVKNAMQKHSSGKAKTLEFSFHAIGFLKNMLMGGTTPRFGSNNANSVDNDVKAVLESLNIKKIVADLCKKNDTIRTSPNTQSLLDQL